MQIISLHRLRPCPLYTPPVAATDWVSWWVVWTELGTGSRRRDWKILQTLTLRGSRSRNKVSVGEPAEGSLTRSIFANKFHLPTESYWNWKSLTVACIIVFDFVKLRVGPVPVCYFRNSSLCNRKALYFILQHVAMDPLARASMKDAAKCAKHCDWQNSANQ